MCPVEDQLRKTGEQDKPHHCNLRSNMMIMMTTGTQQIPTSHFPTRWEYVSDDKGGNLTMPNHMGPDAHTSLTHFVKTC